jgi:hypothetical protein
MHKLLSVYPRTTLCGETLVGDATIHQEQCVNCWRIRYQEITGLKRHITTLEQENARLTNENNMLRERVQELPIYNAPNYHPPVHAQHVTTEPEHQEDAGMRSSPPLPIRPRRNRRGHHA